MECSSAPGTEVEIIRVAGLLQQECRITINGEACASCNFQRPCFACSRINDPYCNDIAVDCENLQQGAILDRCSSSPSSTLQSTSLAILTMDFRNQSAVCFPEHASDLPRPPINGVNPFPLPEEDESGSVSYTHLTLPTKA